MTIFGEAADRKGGLVQHTVYAILPVTPFADQIPCCGTDTR